MTPTAMPMTVEQHNAYVVTELMGFVASDGAQAFGIQWQQTPRMPIDEVLVFLHRPSSFIREAQAHLGPVPKLTEKR